MFERRSGRLWCESTLSHGMHGMEEPMNAISSLWIGCFTLGALLLDSTYVRCVRPASLFVFAAVLSISLSSSYYHATLSLFGQLMDELSLVWASIAGWIVWLPGTPAHFKPLQRTALRAAVLTLGIAYTVLLLMVPQFNAIFLMCSLAWIFGMVRRELQLFPVPSAFILAKYGGIIGGFGIALWIYEQLNCHHLIYIGFPYFHSLWHVLAGTAIHFGLLFCQYCDAFKQHLSPQILWFAGVYPYLRLSSEAVKDTHKA